MSCTQDLLNNNYMDRIAEFRKQVNRRCSTSRKNWEHLKRAVDPALVEHIVVSVYGVKRASWSLFILVADPRTLTIAPWDKSITHAIVEAISDQNTSAGSGEVAGAHIAL